MSAAEDRLSIELAPSALLPTVLIGLVSVIRFGVLPGCAATALFLICLFGHEGGHALFAKLLGAKLSAVGFCAKGTYIKRRRLQGLSEIMIAFAGPAVNLVIAGLLWHQTGMLNWVAQLNMMLGVGNLLPLKGSDGRNILITLRASAPVFEKYSGTIFDF